MALYSQHYYNKMLRKYVIAFGSLFTNMVVTRESSSSEEVHRETVPLTYAPAEKFLVRLAQDGNLDQGRPAIKLPRLAFEMVGINYAPERKTPTLQKCLYRDAAAGTAKYHYNPIPYDINFTLSLMSKSHDDALQIAEQILPFFTPHHTLTINAVEDLKIDVPVSLVSTSQEDSYDNSFDERRLIIWTFEFVMKGFLIGPMRDTALITQSHTAILSDPYGGDLSHIINTAENIVDENDYDVDTFIGQYPLGDERYTETYYIPMSKSQPFLIPSVKIIDIDSGEVVNLDGKTVQADMRRGLGSFDIYTITVTPRDQNVEANVGIVDLTLATEAWEENVEIGQNYLRLFEIDEDDNLFVLAEVYVNVTA